MVLGRYWHSGADLPSYNVLESQSPECSRPVRAPGNGTAFIVASGVRCGLDAPPGPGLAPVMTLTQFRKADLREGPQGVGLSLARESHVSKAALYGSRWCSGSTRRRGAERQEASAYR